MIDPKLNDLPDKSKAGARNASGAGLDEPERTSSAEKPRAGLSVNDTIAADANLSVGGRGADTSGVRAGAGAGAGGAQLSPASSNRSPVPNVEPGPGGAGGTTPLSTSASNLRDRAETSSVSRDEALSHDEIAAHAYRCWHERGCPHGSPEEDWHRAERELREQRTKQSLSATA
jgi:hypothetical protein